MCPNGPNGSTLIDVAISRKLSEQEIESYDLLPAELARKVRVVRLPPVGGPFHGITLGRFVFLGKPTCAKGTSKLLAHELVHVRQWYELGVVGYLLHYIPDFVRELRRQRRWMSAYRDIKAEVEARADADRWKDRCSS